MSIFKADIRCDRQSQVHIERYCITSFVCDKQKQTKSCVRIFENFHSEVLVGVNLNERYNV